jgi:hypothetical protein
VTITYLARGEIGAVQNASKACEKSILKRSVQFRNLCREPLLILMQLFTKMMFNLAETIAFTALSTEEIE